MTIAFHTYSVDPNTNVYTLAGAADERFDLELANSTVSRLATDAGGITRQPQAAFDTLTAR
jgi:hypothetical protein